MPRLALRLLQAAPPSRLGSRSQQVRASVMLADVSGFTGLVDRLASERGDRGAEHLQEALNRCFEPLTDLIDGAGGEVLSFPGDAILAFWSDERITDEVSALVQRSAFCALALQDAMSRLPAIEGIRINLRVAIGAGPCHTALVGGVNGRWSALVRGDALAQLAAALDTARPGEVVLSPEAHALVRANAEGALRGSHLVVSRVDHPSPPSPRPSDVAQGDGDSGVDALVPPEVLARLSLGEGAWLAEFRHATVLFARLHGVGHATIEPLEQAVRCVQAAIGAFGGGMQTVVSDDKGLAVIGAFGIAHGSHDDDAARATRAAMRMRAELAALGVEAHVGIATGRVFTGTLGGASRAELTIGGAPVVLAARLAATARAVVCDSATRVASRRAVRFEALPAVTLKGKTAREEIWRPLSVRPDIGSSGQGLIGRVEEREALARCLLSLERDGTGGVVIIEGEPGIGKTALVRQFIASTQAGAVRVLTGVGDSVSRHEAYLPWRSVTAALLGTDAAADPAALMSRILALIGEAHEPWLPALNPLLPAPLPESDATSNLAAEARARTVRDLYGRLLQACSATTPMVVVLEDLHWMDSASLDLAEHVVATVPRLLLVCTTRADSPNDQARLGARAGSISLRLRPFGESDLQELLCRRLDADAIPADLARLILRRSEGHPLLAEELAVTLREQGAITVHDGICTAAADFDDSKALSSVPRTIQGAIAARIDRLGPAEQLTMKACAVAGREFTVDALSRIHPLRPPTDVLLDELGRIVSAGLLRQLDSGPHAFSFSHAIVQEVAYELLPFAQRRKLHLQAGQWLEQGAHLPQEDVARGTAPDTEHPTEQLPLLAYHWERAEVAEKAMPYLAMAGQRALSRSANREAADLFRRAIAMSGSRPADDAQRTQVARWERWLSEALIHQGQNAPALRHIEKSLRLLGQPMPAASLRSYAELFVDILWRAVRAPRQVDDRADRMDKRDRLLESARGHEAFVLCQYLGAAHEGTKRGGRDFQSALAVMRGTSAAERVGPSGELSRAYSLLANVLALIGLRRRATDYSAHAQAIAERVGDRHALFRALTVGQLPAFVVGRWQEVERSVTRALAIGAELRVTNDCLVYETLLAYNDMNRGLLGGAEAKLHVVRTRATQGGYVVPELWTLVALGEVAYRRGEFGDAIAFAEDSLALASKVGTVDQNSRFQAHGLLALAWLRTAGLERAERHVDEAMAAADAGARLSYTGQSGFAGVFEVLLAQTQAGSGDAARRLRRWLRVLRLVAVARPIFEPWAFIARGRWQNQQGSRQRAIRTLGRAVASADRMELAFESGLARLELGRLLPSDAPGRHAVLGEAVARFESIEAAGLLHDARAELARTP